VEGGLPFLAGGTAFGTFVLGLRGFLGEVGGEPRETGGQVEDSLDLGEGGSAVDSTCVP